MWSPGEDIGELNKSPESIGWVRVFYTQEGITQSEEVVRRVAITVSAPSGHPYTFEPVEGERFSEFVPVATEEDAQWFRDHSPFHYRGKR